ncbi:MAG: biotin--[acetyl-CoA-carboxylase] ligase [Rothia sp. (in: high G+C Gram-positive bacteria)]|nr:biotin--[acetyl-CoA-carboxylase] ligase [Rothia sp. (in: high G+C Gram-positive bacteria)]
MTDKLLDNTALLLEGFSPVILLDSVDSTNDYLSQILSGKAGDLDSRWQELSLVATTNQLAGHGRLRRKWVSPEAGALCLSVGIRPQLPISPEQYHWFSLILALAALDSWAQWGIQAQLKWPNDVLVAGKKVCGILGQVLPVPDGDYAAVVGIGMNLNMTQGQLPVETATSALIQTGRRVDPNQALVSICQHFLDRYRRFMRLGADPSASSAQSSSLLQDIRQVLVTLGMQVSIELPDGTVCYGRADDISARGELLLTDQQGRVRSFAVGDLVHLRPVKS